MLTKAVFGLLCGCAAASDGVVRATDGVELGAGTAAAALDFDVARIKAAATKLFVENIGTGRDPKGNGPNKVPYLKSVDSIDRALRVHFTIPALNAWPSNVNDKLLTCNQTWTCGASDFEACPGMKVNNAQVRDFGGDGDTLEGGVPKTPPSNQYKPKVTFDVTKGKYYSLLMQDLLNPEWNPAFGDQYMHWAVYNMEEGDSTKGTESDETATDAGSYQMPSNPDLIPNHYTFMLFQHDEKIDLQPIRDGFAADQLNTIDKWLQNTGLTSANLVAVNWLEVSASPVSIIRLTRNGFGALVSPDICEKYTGTDMCGGGQAQAPKIDTICAEFAWASDSNALAMTVSSLVWLTLAAAVY